MKLADKGENYLLKRLRSRFGRKSPGLILGVGDDAAVVAPSAGHMLLTSDLMAEGVHFDLRWTTPYQLGFKLVSVNVSDIYAMGGKPEFMLIAFSAPGDFTLDEFEDFFDGVSKASVLYGVTLVGGDISSSGSLNLSATVTGYSEGKPLLRSGARPGDFIYVTGHPGDSACGLELLKKMKRPIPDRKREVSGMRPIFRDSLRIMRRHVMPVAVKPDRFIGHATAMMDISDGLMMDLSRLCLQSGAGARIYTDKLPLSKELITASAYLGKDPVDLALAGGEDYELLFTSASKKIAGATPVGEIIRSGFHIIDKDGAERIMRGKGYQHFAS
ncbi:MAG: thiamine-phosphate kinase [Nitrospirae bacterium]|nr:thiamine-phosphate kinase [Nitrospirota bacterium]